MAILGDSETADNALTGKNRLCLPRPALALHWDRAGRAVVDGRPVQGPRYFGWATSRR